LPSWWPDSLTIRQGVTHGDGQRWGSVRANLRIGRKIGAGFAIVMLILAVSSTTTWLACGRVTAVVDESATLVANAGISREIASNVQQAAQGTCEIATDIGGVGQAARAPRAPVALVLSAAELARSSVTLRQDVDRRVATVRAASSASAMNQLTVS
jgi:hypothetical protein